MTSSSREFGNETDCVNYLLSLITAGVEALPSEARTPLGRRIATEFKAPTGEAPAGGFSVVVDRWVVRDDDLKLFEEFNRALVAAAGASFFVDHTKVIAAGIGVGVAAFSIVRNGWRSTAHLSNDELVILLAIKSAEPPRPKTTDLALTLKTVARSSGEFWSESDVEQTLVLLKEYPTKSGLKKFIAQDSAGGWGVEGI
jgi:hypothetical protein